MPPREGLAARPLRRVQRAGLGEAPVEPVDQAGDQARVDDVRDVGLAVDDVGARRLRAVARLAAELDRDHRVGDAVGDRDREAVEAVEPEARSRAPSG